MHCCFDLSPENAELLRCILNMQCCCDLYPEVPELLQLCSTQSSCCLAVIASPAAANSYKTEPRNKSKRVYPSWPCGSVRVCSLAVAHSHKTNLKGSLTPLSLLPAARGCEHSSAIVCGCPLAGCGPTAQCNSHGPPAGQRLQGVCVCEGKLQVSGGELSMPVC